MRPDYKNNSIVNLMSSLIAGLNGEPNGYIPLDRLEPAEIAAYRQVVLLVVDGMGDRFLDRHGGSCLAEHRRTRLTSVFPSTTASAISTFLTGTAPQQHGITGWHMYFRELGAVLAVLPGVPRYGGSNLKSVGLDPRKFFGHTPVFDLLPVTSHVLAPRYIANSDFNLAHLGRAHLHPFDGLADLFGTLTSILKSDESRRYVYAYWPELDHIGHESGLSSKEADWHFRQLDKAFEQLLKDSAQTDTLVIVTADHGFIDTHASRTIDLSDHPAFADCLVLPLCGERRAAYCYVRPERGDFFERYVERELADIAEWRRAREMIDEGWFGLGEPNPALLSRSGDYVLLMKDNYTIKDRLFSEPPNHQLGVHGGVSDEEMWVPLIVAAPRH